MQPIEKISQYYKAKNWKKLGEYLKGLGCEHGDALLTQALNEARTNKDAVRGWNRTMAAIGAGNEHTKEED